MRQFPEGSSDGGPAPYVDPWTVIRLTSDFSTTSATVVNVPGLSFAPAAGKTYLIHGLFLLRTSLVTAGARIGIAWPTGMDDGACRLAAPSSLTAETLRFQNVLAPGTALSTGLPTTTGSYLGTLDAIAVAGASPSGNIQITLLSELLGTSVTMSAHSLIRFREIT